MATRLSWSFSLAFRPFCLPTVETSLELVDEEPAPAPVAPPDQDQE